LWQVHLRLSDVHRMVRHLLMFQLNAINLVRFSWILFCGSQVAYFTFSFASFWISAWLQ
jgi:hypothetical protein